MLTFYYVYIKMVKTQDVVLILLLVVVLVLLTVRVSSGYTPTQAQQLMSSIPGSAGLMPSVVNFYVASLQGQPLLPYANAVLQQIPTERLVTPLVPYTSESQLQTMFTTAASNGESGLTFTDRVLLRALTAIWTNIVSSPQVASLGLSVTYDSQGKVSWSDSVLNQTGQTVQQNMLFIFQLVQTNAGGAVTQEIVDKLNHVLPSNLTPVRDPIDWDTKAQTLTTSTPDPTMVWFFKYVFVGPAYLAWVAENVYHLDPTFMAWNSPANAPESTSPSL
jgi:hypothetical protein